MTLRTEPRQRLSDAERLEALIRAHGQAKAEQAVATLQCDTAKTVTLRKRSERIPRTAVRLAVR